MQLRLAHFATGLLIASIVLSGIVNNVISGVCVLGALISWAACVQSKESYWLGLLAVIGWIGIAAFCATAFR